MYSKRILISLICAFLFFKGIAQTDDKPATIEAHSLDLFNSAQWKALLIYGKEKIAAGNDDGLLRMRVGYAAFMLGNYSQSLIQYKKVFDEDPENNVALYYVYLNNLYLNNLTAAKYYAQKLPEEMKVSEKIKGTKLSGIQFEFSNKMPDDTARRNAQYVRAGINVDLGYRFQLQQSLAYYTLLVNTTAGNKVVYQRLQQPEYYAKLVYAATDRLSLIGAYHFIRDQFPDRAFYNNIVLGGIKYTSPYFSVQANGSFTKFISNYSQIDGIVTVYPLGNLNLYSISRGSFGTQTNFAQVLGAKVVKGLWLEGNMTVGEATYLFENDALYVKNDSDPLLFRCGGSMYSMLSKKLLLSLNYTFEQKRKYLTTNNFYQHSINGGLSWKF
jgi:tetratricopeptide (TPR) repeat protein